MSNTKAKTLEAAPTIADSRRFVVWLAVPTVLLFAASCVFVLWVLFVSAERLNAAALEGERRLAVSAVDAGVQRLSKAVADYSFWDDMYEQFNGHYDPQWSRDNLDDYVLDAFEVDVVMVADAAGDLNYDYSRKGHGVFAVAEGDRQKLAEAVQIALRGWKPGQSSAVAGVLTFNGHPYVTAIGPISLSNEESIDPNKPPRLALAYLEALDGTWTAKISKTIGLEALRVVDAGPGTRWRCRTRSDPRRRSPWRGRRRTWADASSARCFRCRWAHSASARSSFSPPRSAWRARPSPTVIRYAAPVPAQIFWVGAAAPRKLHDARISKPLVGDVLFGPPDTALLPRPNSAKAR